MIKRRTCVKDPSGDDVYYQQNDEAVHDKEKAISATEKLQCEFKKKDEETWKLDKRIEDLEKASVYPAVAKERTSQMKQNHEEHIIEKYEKDLEDTRAREQHYARNAAILSKELKQEKLWHTETWKKLQETEQKLQNELRRKDNEIIQQLKKSEDIAQVELAATTADEKIMLIEQTKASSVVVDTDRKNDTQTMKQETWVSTSDSAQSQPYTDEDIKRMKRRIQELELLNAHIKQRLEKAEMQLKANDGFTHPEHKIPDRLKRCHDIFICSNESGYEKLEKKLAHADSKFIHVVNVHGRIVKKDFKEIIKVRYAKYIPPQARKKGRSSPEFDFRRLTPLGKIILLGIIEDIYRLHRRGFCLDGRFTLESFYWTDEKKIKLDPCLKLIAASVERSQSCMINDYHRIHEIIMQILVLFKETASEDLEQLLDLLNCDDPVAVQDIIRYNVSLMTEITKGSHFLTLYGRWRQMEDQEEKMEEDKDKPIKAEGSEFKIPNSKRVLQFIPTSIRDSDGQEDWSNLVYLNEHVKRTYHRRCVLTGKNKLYGAKEVLTVWRNALSHMLEGSLSEEKIEFFDEDVVNMLEFVLPGVFNLFQKGMHSVGHEELPHLMRIMRM